VFGANGGKFLGFMLTQRGVEANLEKCKVIIEMRSPTNIKEIQRLIGRLTTISQFLARFANKIRPMIRLLKKSAKFAWGEECQKMFDQLKEILSSPMILRKPNIREPIIVYIATTDVFCQQNTSRSRN